MSFRYVSLFSGAGGLDIGLERAGFEAVTLCEIDKVFCNTLSSNKGWKHEDGNFYFSNSKIINSDIREVKGIDLVVGKKNIDLVVGGPPCQAFSSSGKQLSVLDPRGLLVNEFIRVIDELKPKMFLFENVRGLVTARDIKGEPGGVITNIIKSLEDLGYSCRSTLLNSADYGSYQRRVRCFIVGSKRGCTPTFPLPTHHKDSDLLLAKWNTLRDFLIENSDKDSKNYTYPTLELAEQLKSLSSGTGLKSIGKAEATRPGGHWGYRQGTFIADLDLPARTVTGSASQDWIRWNRKLRRLTFNEIKLLQGFTNDWIVEGNKSEIYKQIGNAVPTIFGEVLGNFISEHLNNFPKTSPVKLGVPHSFTGYINYTKRDHERNSASRSIQHNFSN